MVFYYGSLSWLECPPSHTQIKGRSKVRTAFSKGFCCFLLLFFFFGKVMAEDEKRSVHYQWVTRDVQWILCPAPFIKMTRKWFLSNVTQSKVGKYTWPLGLFIFLTFSGHLPRKFSSASCSATCLHYRQRENSKGQFPHASGTFPVTWSTCFGGKK